MKRILLALLVVPVIMWGYGKLGIFFEIRGLVAENTALKAQVAAIKSKPVAQAPPIASPWLLQDKPKDKRRHISRPGIEEKHLRRVIDKVLVYLEVPDREHWERLIYLTALVESDGGRYLKQVKGPARSPFQTEPETEKDILRWCKVKHPELYQKIRSLRFPARLEVHEAECNLAYAVALCYLEYYWRKANPVGKSVKELCEIHKKLYNTFLGKATVERSLRLIKKFNVNL